MPNSVEVRNSLPAPETPDKMYLRGLSGKNDIYVIKSGPGYQYGPGYPLFHIEVPAGEAINEAELAERMQWSISSDAQPPHLLSRDELADLLESYQESQLEIARQETTEFEQLTGTHVLPEL